MARISYIKAWGLWSHYETVMNFAPGLTVIVGPNGSGKTTAARILQWVFLGHPTGDDFLFKQEDEVTGEVIRETKEGKAEIGLDNGVVITKTRRKGKTEYTHSDYAEPFGKADVPQEIIDALGIKAYQYGDFKTYLNFAFQLEAPFLISESPSVGAKVLGKIAGTEVIDLSISDVAKRTHKARTEKTAADKDVERLTGKLLEYQGLEDIRNAVELCEKLLTEIETDYQRKEHLMNLDHSLDHIQDNIDGHINKLNLLKNVDVVGQKLEDIKKDQQSYTTLLDFISKLLSTNDTIKECTSQLTLFEGVDAAAAILKDMERIEQRLTNITSLSTLYTKYAHEANKHIATLAELGNVTLIGEIIEQVEKDNNEMDKLETLAMDYDVACFRIKSHQETLRAVENVEQVKVLLNTIEANSDRLNVIQVLLKRYNVEDEAAKKLHNKLLTFTNIQTAGGQLKQIEIDLERLNLIDKLNNEYANACIKVAGEETTLKLRELDLTTAEKELQEAWSAAGGICPLCDQPISTHKH